MTKARDLASAAPAPAGVTATELGYVDGVTSAIQTQLNQKPEFAAGKNTVINGGMDIWQRGTSIAGTTTSFSADRWQSYRSVAGSTFSRQTGPDGIQYCVRVQRDSGNTSTTGIFLTQNFETVNSIPLAGKTVTLSFYARAGSNYSRVSSGLAVSLATGTGTDQNGLTGSYTGSATAISQTATLTTTWQRFTYSATLAATTTELNTTFSFTPVGTAGTNDYYEVTGVQLEAANTASNFQRAAGNIQGELAACQRYYYRQTANNNAYQNFGFGMVTNSTTSARIQISNPVTMRSVPSSIDFATLRTTDYGSGYAVSAVTFGETSFYTTWLTVTMAAGTAYRPVALGADNSTSGYIGISAEL